MAKIKNDRLSPRLTQRLTEYRQLSNNLFIEDIVIYSSVMAACLGYDIFFNILYSVGLVPEPRPLNFGFAQIILFGAFGILLVRKIAHWRRFKAGD
jgi:hypothetical protein